MKVTHNKILGELTNIADLLVFTPNFWSPRIPDSFLVQSILTDGNFNTELVGKKNQNAKIKTTSLPIFLRSLALDCVVDGFIVL